jgi:hypothetical protein
MFDMLGVSESLWKDSIVERRIIFRITGDDIINGTFCGFVDITRLTG